MQPLHLYPTLGVTRKIWLLFFVRGGKIDIYLADSEHVLCKTYHAIETFAN